jgi:hypothetical protein
MVSLEGGCWKSAQMSNSLAAYPTASTVLGGELRKVPAGVTRLAPTLLHAAGPGRLQPFRRHNRKA